MAYGRPLIRALCPHVDWGSAAFSPDVRAAHLGRRWPAVIAYIYGMKPSAAVHEDFSREEEVKGSSDRAFGLTFAAAFALLALWPIVRHRPMRSWAVAAAVVFAVVALLRPQLLGPGNRAWLRLGLLLQRVVTPGVMALLFYSTVTPTALVLRLLGKDLLSLRIDRSAQTYWIARRPPGPAPDTMRRQF
jgi:hypothetical protein